MRHLIDPGKERRTINFADDIVYSHVRDLEGKPLDLAMSLMLQNGNSEMRLAVGVDDEVSTGLQPLILWINGAGWRGPDKNIMIAELEYFAEAGYAVACIYYRGSDKGKWPAQLIDCKTAVRFIRAHAAEYGIDPNRIAAFGRSAGGHLASWMAMNTDGFDTDEWSEESSHVQCAVSFFGASDIEKLAGRTLKAIREDPNFRWKTPAESHEGALMGGDPDTIQERGRAASPMYYINEKTAPLALFHGDLDPLVPVEISEDFYEKLVQAGLEGQSELYIVKNGGHGTRELFQNETKQLALEFFDRYLR